MMDKLGANTSWYDKWVSDRAGQVEYGEWGTPYETVVETTTLESQNIAKTRVASAFKRLEYEDQETALQSFKTALPKNYGGMGLSEAQIEAYESTTTLLDLEGPPLMEMQQIDLSALEMPYYSVDENMAPISVSGDVVEWDLLGLASGEFAEIAVGALAFLVAQSSVRWSLDLPPSLSTL